MIFDAALISFQHTDTMQELFVYRQDSMTEERSNQLYDIEWCDKGSNLLLQEEDTIFCLEMFITYCFSEYT